MELRSEETKQKLKELRALRDVVLAQIRAKENELVGIDIRIRAIERRGQFT